MRPNIVPDKGQKGARPPGAKNVESRDQQMNADWRQELDASGSVQYQTVPLSSSMCALLASSGEVAHYNL